MTSTYQPTELTCADMLGIHVFDGIEHLSAYEQHQHDTNHTTLFHLYTTPTNTITRTQPFCGQCVQVYLGRLTVTIILSKQVAQWCDFKGVGHFEAKFYVEGLRFAPISTDR